MAQGLGGPQFDAWRAFLGAHASLTDRLAAELEAEVGLPLTWYDVLVNLNGAGGRLRMQELAAAVLLSRSGVTRLVDRMESAGLVRREPVECDRRGLMAVLTDAGHARLREAAPVHLAGVERHFGSLVTDDEAEVLRTVLERLSNRPMPDC